MNGPDWERLYRLNHHFRAVSAAVGDRHRPLGPWRIFGFIGEHQFAQGTTHGPWRPTQDAALRAVYRRALTTGRISEETANVNDDDHYQARRAVLDNFHAPDETHPQWWINPDAIVDAVAAAVLGPIRQGAALVDRTGIESEGITLTPEEAGIAARGIREWLHQLDRYIPTLQYGPAAFRDNASALADRLEKVAGR